MAGGQRAARAVALLMLGSTGCSLLFVDGPSSARPAHVYPSCTESRVKPVVDAALAVLFGASALNVAASTDTSTGSPMFDASARKERNNALIGGAVWVLGLGASSYVGFSRTGRCRDERARFLGEARPDAPAGEGQVCHPVAGCSEGLTCASNHCVRFEPEAVP